MHPQIPRIETLNAAAGFWPRAVAWLLDALIVVLPVAGLAALTGDARWDALRGAWHRLGTTMGKTVRASVERGEAPLAMLQTWWSPASSIRIAIHDVASAVHGAVWPWFAAFIVFSVVYWPLQEAGPHRATLGKRLLGLLVETTDGVRISLRHALLRHAAGALSWLTLNIGHLLAANAPEHQALHDRIANTRVAWRESARRTVPFWGWLLMAAACLLPLLLATYAASTLAVTMRAALGW